MADVTTESALLNLAERCEQATGPDKALDAELALHAGWWNVFWHQPLGPWKGQNSHGDYGPVPAFTASIDSALTLVPEGMDWAVGWSRILPTSAKVGGKPAVEAATPALAICAAAIRAKAASA